MRAYGGMCASVHMCVRVFMCMCLCVYLTFQGTFAPLLTCVVCVADWVMVEYEKGQPYHHACSQEERRSIIMVTCDPGNSQVSVYF
jgi:hypothetical protein